MSEYKFPNQVNYGWGLTLDRTSKTPLESKRIFDTLASAKEYVNNFKDSAIPGLTISVINDGDNNGLYYVYKIKSNSNDSEGRLEKVGSDVKSVDIRVEDTTLVINVK